PPPPAATALVGELRLFIPLSGLIDKEAEIARLEKAIARLEKDIQRAEQKLANPNFIERAPREVVEKEKRRLSDLRSELEKLREQKARMEAL
ncbi:MAG: hypothetical protein D6819_00705, partial [Gammaproteobacteria bacterium]